MILRRRVFRKDFVLIDCYSPSFAFTDDIHEQNDRQLKAEGVAHR